MHNDTSIFSKKDYGHVRIKLKELMEENGITRYALAKKIDSRFIVIDKWFSGEIERIDLDVLARICYVLNCSVSDVLEYCQEEQEAAE